MIVGISRKTLDDYYLQIKRAKYLQFDFNRHINSKMGILRKFVKNQFHELPSFLKKNTNSVDQSYIFTNFLKKLSEKANRGDPSYEKPKLAFFSEELSRE